MSLIRYNSAFNDFAPITFTSLIDKFFNDNEKWGGSRLGFVPKVDIWETEKGYDLHVAVPGMKKEDFKIDLNEKYLTISGERKLNREVKEDHYHSIESSYGSFSRTFTLPENVESSGITARYADGVLEVHIPRNQKKLAKTTIKVD